MSRIIRLIECKLYIRACRRHDNAAAHRMAGYLHAYVQAAPTAADIDWQRTAERSLLG